MWVKLSNEHINLDHVMRIRFSTGWKNGEQQLLAEVEGVNGQVVWRHRGADAEALLRALPDNNTWPVDMPVRETLRLAENGGLKALVAV